jgi:hypothetical protein
MKTFWIVSVMLAALAVSSFAAAQEQSVTGEWLAVYRGTGGEALKFYLTLKQEGEKVTGTLMNPSVTPPVLERPVSGTFKDGTLVLGGIRATVTGNTMTGTMSARTGQGLTFSGTRSK